MNISIGINSFKQEKDLDSREKNCLESIKKVKDLSKHNISLYNISFEEDDIKYKDFESLTKLKLSSDEVIREYFKHEGLQNEYNLKKNDIDTNTKKLPIINEILDVLSETDCDYFLFLNSDCILTPAFNKLQIENFDSYSLCRANTDDKINSLSDSVELEAISVHGVDGLLIKKDVWLSVRNNFEKFIIGRFYWDSYFSSKLKLLTKSKYLNQSPFLLLHENHSNRDDMHIENYYAEDIFKRDILTSHLWFKFANYLEQRKTKGKAKWFIPLPDENKVEESLFTIPSATLPINENFNKPNIESTDKYDVFIPVHSKDQNKLKYVIERVFEFLTPDKIYVCSPTNIEKIKDSNIEYVLDADILDHDKQNIGFRPNWTYQQFLKTFQNVTSNDYYLSLDSDILINKKIDFFEDNHPIWHYGWRQNHFPYFYFNKKNFKLDKTLTHTGIGDIGFFNKKITKSLLDYTGVESAKELLLNVGPYTNNVFHFSEFETYANFCNTYYEDLYKFKPIKQQNNGKDLNKGENWDSNSLDSINKESRLVDADVVSIHSWLI
jgi:hypothetical protein